MASRTMAASVTVRVIGPCVSVVGFAGIKPWRLTSSRVGRKPTSDATAAGPRMEPPVSSPMPTIPRLVAMPTAVPPEDPLGLRERSKALRIIPKPEPT